MNKPMLACDWDEAKVKFPCIVQPKIDGVRALNLNGTLTGRSLKLHKNRHVTRLFSDNTLMGFDGEMAAQCETHAALCRITSSALSTIDGHPFVLWWLFDFVHKDWCHRPYIERYHELVNRVEYLQMLPDEDAPFAKHLRVVPVMSVENMDQLLKAEKQWLDMGYEGLIGRDPQGKVKFGHSTVREGGLWRIKRFVDDEAVVKHILEGQRNENAAVINELGKTERSSHAENMVPNGEVGTLVCDFKGDEINVSPGEMTQEECKMYFKQPELIVGKTITFKHFPKGVKNKPRYATFKCIREDL